MNIMNNKKNIKAKIAVQCLTSNESNFWFKNIKKFQKKYSRKNDLIKENAVEWLREDRKNH